MSQRRFANGPWSQYDKNAYLLCFAIQPNISGSSENTECCVRNVSFYFITHLAAYSHNFPLS